VSAEKLGKLHGIVLGRETARKWMIADVLWLDRKQRVKRFISLIAGASASASWYRSMAVSIEAAGEQEGSPPAVGYRGRSGALPSGDLPPRRALCWRCSHAHRSIYRSRPAIGAFTRALRD